MFFTKEQAPARPWLSRFQLIGGGKRNAGDKAGGGN